VRPPPYRSATMASKTLDLLLWGASSFTGALVAEYVAGRYGNDTSVRIGLGGRTKSKLEEIRTKCEAVCAKAKVGPPWHWRAALATLR